VWLDLLLDDFARLVLDDVGRDSETQTNRRRLRVLLVRVVIHVERCVDRDARCAHLQVQDVGVRPALQQVLKLYESLTAVRSEGSVIGRQELVEGLIRGEPHIVHVLGEDFLVRLHLKLICHLGESGLPKDWVKLEPLRVATRDA